LIYIFPLTALVYLHSHFSGGLRKMIFSSEVRFGRSRSSKVIGFGTSRKRVCNFLLVRHITLVLSCTISKLCTLKLSSKWN